MPRRSLMLAGASAAALVAGIAVLTFGDRHAVSSHSEISTQAKRGGGRYRPTDVEWTNFVLATVEQRAFRPEQFTEGKIAVDEDRTTPIFPPYSGRVIKLAAKPGDKVERGQLLFVVEATDTVQALNDFMGALSAAQKARSAVALAQIVEKRNRDLYDAKAVPLREVQNSQTELVGAQNNVRASEAALTAARNRLHLLGRTDAEIAAFEQTGKISAEMAINAPIAGTVVQRKLGPGQFVSASASDPAFVIGDLSKVWITAYVREADATKISVGQDVQCSALAYPDQVFSAKIDYVAASLDPATRRILVRATVDNPGERLKPEMLANVTVIAAGEERVAAVPSTALTHEGNQLSVWVAHDDRTIELRGIKIGPVSGVMVQVLDGLTPGERVITGGSLVVARAAPGS
jgi:cobalt-zinc-cadmium efflux system membrane fusion protein